MRHLDHEWVGHDESVRPVDGVRAAFEALRRIENSGRIAAVPADDWKGGFVLLVIVFVLSAFLDNIAAALIGGTMANVVFRGKVHIGYLAGIVAASNAGGAGSVVGDTTTTMMWIDGVSPLDVLHAYVAAGVALVVCGIPAAIQQHRYSPISTERAARAVESTGHASFIVVIILAAAIARKRRRERRVSRRAGAFPADRRGGLGRAACDGAAAQARLVTAARDSFKGTVFLLSLVAIASMMPVDKLPPASWHSAMGLGFISAVFDNIPLTALALEAGRLRLGHARVHGRFRRLDDLVRLERRRRAVEPVSARRNPSGSWGHGGWHVSVAYVVGFFVSALRDGLDTGAHPYRALARRRVIAETVVMQFASDAARPVQHISARQVCGEEVETRQKAELDVIRAGPSCARTAHDERHGWLFCVSGADNVQIRRDSTHI